MALDDTSVVRKGQEYRFVIEVEPASRANEVVIEDIFAHYYDDSGMSGANTHSWSVTRNSEFEFTITAPEDDVPCGVLVSYWIGDISDTASYTISGDENLSPWTLR